MSYPLKCMKSPSLHLVEKIKMTHTPLIKFFMLWVFWQLPYRSCNDYDPIWTISGLKSSALLLSLGNNCQGGSIELRTSKELLKTRQYLLSLFLILYCWNYKNYHIIRFKIVLMHKFTWYHTIMLRSNV